MEHATIQGLESEHVELEEVAGGVVAALARRGGGALSNGAIVDLGDRTLLFDAFITPQAAGDVRAAAERLLGRPVAFAVNSHWHLDHVGGNRALDATTVIVATTGTRELVATAGAEQLGRLKAVDGPAYLRELAESVAAETDLERRRALEVELAEARHVYAALPGMVHRLPEQTFDERVTFHGSRRSAELLTWGGGHTGSDAFLWLPADRVLLAGDLVTVGCHPLLVHGDPAAWAGILDRLADLDPAVVVPGHGKVGGADDVRAVRRYLDALDALAAQDPGPDGAPGEGLPAELAGWEWPEQLARNLEFLRARSRPA